LLNKVIKVIFEMTDFGFVKFIWKLWEQLTATYVCSFKNKKSWTIIRIDKRIRIQTFWPMRAWIQVKSDPKIFRIETNFFSHKNYHTALWLISKYKSPGRMIIKQQSGVKLDRLLFCVKMTLHLFTWAPSLPFLGQAPSMYTIT
jgi:hypothetical protein